MRAAVTYNDTVRALFANPAHAGNLPAGSAPVFAAEATEAAQGAYLQLAAAITNGTVAALSYRVRGCPHLVALLELFCTRCEGGPVRALEKPDFADITRELALPVEKSGRILLLEDAVAALWAQYAGSAD